MPDINFKPKQVTVFLAVFVVFLMTASGFFGAAENSSFTADDEMSILPSNPVAVPSELIEPNLEDVDNSIVAGEIDNTDVEHPEAIIPGVDGEMGTDQFGAFPDNDWSEPEEVTHNDPNFPSQDNSESSQNAIDPNIPSSVERNTISSGLEYITEKNYKSDTVTSISITSTSTELSSETNTRSGSASIVLGADNPIYPGNGLGRVYGTPTSTTMYSYDYPYWYHYYYPSSTSRYKTWAVYDLSDLGNYKNIKITDGKIHYWQYYRYYITGIDIWTMTSIPYDISGTSTTAKTWYDEIGGSSSVKVATATFSTTSDTTRKDMWINIQTSGITELNKRLAAENYAFSMGAEVTSSTSTSSNYAYWGDVRLELNFTYTAMPDEALGELAIGDRIAGYGSSSTKYDYYNYIYFSSSYVGYASWDTTTLKSLVPSKGPGGEEVIIKGIYLRFNAYSISGSQTVTAYDMTNDPLTTTSWSTLYNDARTGTSYNTLSLSGTAPTEIEWYLGEDALDDFNETLDGSPSFFALGFTSTYYAYCVSPKLVVKWKIQYPPMKTLTLGADNPEKAGQAMGYSQFSSSSYYCYSQYYMYPYITTTYERHGWVMFDLNDVNVWDGVKVKRAQLVIHNYITAYGDTYNFTTLKTTPYDNPGTTIAKAVYDETGSSGTVIGQYSPSTSYDSTAKTIVVDLNAAAVSSINTKLSSSSTYLTWGVGSYVDSIQSGYSYAYARWTDVRLRLKFEYDSELQPTEKGEGIAYGDDWSGRVYKYTSATDYPQGYWYIRKYSSSDEYRCYAQWDVWRIRNSFDMVNISNVKIKKVSLRFNHQSSSISGISVYQMTKNVTVASADDIFADCADGTKYYSSTSSLSSTFAEYEWDLGKAAVEDFQAAFEDNSPTFFGLGIITTSTSTYGYDYSPRLVIEWNYPPPQVLAELTEEPVGIEGTPLMFNANASRNLTGGVAGLRYEWDWDNDGVFDQIKTSPYVNRSWPDNITVNITLRVNDTISGQNTSHEFTVYILNAHPSVNTTFGKILPQPAYEANNVTFSGYTVEDPAQSYDTYWYFWDFDGDLEYDVNGKCNGTLIPPVQHYYDDDFMGEVSLLVIDEDGGSSNVTFPHKVTATPSSTSPYGTGYVYYYGTLYESSVIYYRYETTYDYQRGWAKIDLSEIPEDAMVKTVKFKATVVYNNSVNYVGVHLLSSDPLSASATTVFDEAGSGPRLFGFTADTGDKEKDLTPFLQTKEGQENVTKALGKGWIAFGFDHESPTTGSTYGYLGGYSYNLPALEIEYDTSEPGCLIPIQVRNMPPVMDCKNVTLWPTTVKEGDTIHVNNISFCDVGNDTYEAQVVVGGIYESDWVSLGERPVPGTGGGALKIIEDFETGTGWPWSPWVTYASGGSVSTTAAHDGDYGFIGTGGWYYRTDVSLGKKGEKITSWSYTTASGRTYMGFGATSSGCWSLVVAPNTGTLIIQQNSGYGYSDLVSTSVSWTLSKWYYTEIEFLDDSGKVKGSLYDSDGTTFITSVETTLTSFKPGGVAIRAFSNLYFDTIAGGAPGSGGGPPFTGKNLALDAVASHGGGGTGVWGPDRLNNGDKIGTYNDCWTSGSSGQNWIQLDWDKPVTVGSMIVYYTRYRVLTGYTMHSCDVEWWDGTKWQNDQHYDDNDHYNSNKDAYIIMKTPRTTTKLRLSNMLTYGGNTNIMIQEWEVFGGTGGGIEGWGAYGAGCFNVNLTINMTVPDDYPSMGTSWDNLPVTVNVRDDDDHKLLPGTGVGGMKESTVVTPGAYYSYAPTTSRKIAIDKDYNIYVIYVNYQTSPYTLYIGKSSDNGETWEQHKVSTASWFDSGYQFYPSLAVDSKGTLHAVWNNYYNTIVYASSTDGGETWGNWHNVTTGYFYQTALAIDGNDNLHIAFYGYTITTPYSVYYINCTSTGTWGKVQQLSESSLYAYYPTIAADSKGNVHVAWYGYTSTSTISNIRHIYYSASTYKWSSITDITSGSYYNYYPCITVDSSDNAHLVWYGYTSTYSSNYNILYSKWSASTQSWGTVEFVTQEASNCYQYYPSIAVNAKGEIDVIFTGYIYPTGSPYVVHHAYKSGSIWKVDWNIYMTGGYQYYANMFCSPQHNVAKSGYAFIWYDSYYTLRYWASEDFEYGNPKFTDGMDSCNQTIRVENVAPKLMVDRVYTVPSTVKEQEPFTLYAEFEDPAAGYETEIFEYNLTWIGGGYTGWQKVETFKPGVPGGLKERTFQPGPTDGIDTMISRYYPDYNFATYVYSMIGAYNSLERGLIKWDLSSIPSGYNVTKAKMTLTYSYRSSSSDTLRWFAIDESWDEGTNYYETATGPGATWNNQPTFNTSKLIATDIWSYGSSIPIEYDLNLSIVQDWIDHPNTNFGMITDFENQTTSGAYGYYFTSDYSTQTYWPKLELEFEKPLPAVLPRGIIQASNMIPDDHPNTGTPFDLIDLQVELRDDDLGQDKAMLNVTVHNVPPEVRQGTITPEILVEKGTIEEGTMVTLEGFEFDDVAYDVWSEKDYGFNYSVDWGDGTPPTEWKNDFVYTGGTGGGGGGGGAFGGRALIIWSDYDDAGLTTYLQSDPRFSYVTAYNGQTGTPTLQEMLKYDVIVTWTNYPYYDTDTMGDNLKAYVDRGGGVVVCTFGHFLTASWRLGGAFLTYRYDPIYLQDSYSLVSTSIGTVAQPGHKIMDGVTQVSPGYNFYTNQVSSNALPIFYWANGYIGCAIKQIGAGRTVGLNQWPGGDSGADCDKLIANAMVWAGGGEGKAIAKDVNKLSSAYNNGRKLVMDSKDNLYAVYTDGSSPSQISLTNSSDQGESWTVHAVTSTSTAQLEPSIAIDSKDTLHVVWRGMVSGYHNIRYANSADGGKTWGNFKDITTGSSSPTLHMAPSIAIDSNDKVHIVWYGQSTSNNAAYNIHYISRTSSGTWSSIKMLTTDTSDMYHQYPSIAVDSKNDLHIVWSGQTSSLSANNIQYTMYDSSLDTWSSVTMLTSSSSNDNLKPNIAIDRNDNIHIVWYAEPSPTQIKCITYDATTSTWGSAETVSTNGSATNLNPTIGVDYRGYLYVIWYKLSPYQLMMRMFDITYWTSEYEMTNIWTYNSTVYHPNILYGGKHGFPARGTCFVFTADNGSAYNLHYMATADFNITDFGPWKGIPTMKHLYSDDNPSLTEMDVYTVKVLVRDDDTGIGEWAMTFEITNAWPQIDTTKFVAKPVGPESAFYTPPITFTDAGSGPTETWKLWLDMDDSETWTTGDLFYNDTTTPDPMGNKLTYNVEMVNGKSQVTIAPMKLPYNDNYDGTIGCYVYDDDIPTEQYMINITYPIFGDGKVHTVWPSAQSSSTYYWNSNNLVMDSKGNLYAVYYDDPTPYQIYCSVSEDMGETWTQYKVTSDSGSSGYYQYYPGIAIDSKDVLHVVWYGYASGYSSYYNIRYANSKDGGKTWGSHTMVTKGTSSPNYMYAPSIAVDSNDKVHIVWYGYSYLTNTNPYNIHYINRTSSGTWSSITMVTSYTSTSYQYYPSIAVDTKDNVHVAWSGYTPWGVTYYNIQYKKLDAKTGKWGPVVMITNSSSEYNYYPNIVADLKDNIHIAWFGYPSPYQIKYVRYNASSASWDSIETVFNDGNYNYYPSISVDQRGYVYICWHGGSTYMIKLSRKTNPTGSWSTPYIVTSDPMFTSSQYYPSLMGHGPYCYPKQGAAVVWSGYTGSSYDVMYYSTDDFWLGETFEQKGYKDWMEICVENTPPKIIAPPEVYFLPGDKLELSIQLSDSGSDDIYFNLDWGDSTPIVIKKYYNNGVSPEPIYPPTHSALNGTAPFDVKVSLEHIYSSAGLYYINVTVWDDDSVGGDEVKLTIVADVVRPKKMKEMTVNILEQLLPGRLDYVGYDTLKLKYYGDDAERILVYNQINRPPYYWESKLFATLCDVQTNDTILINGSLLAEGMFGTSIIMKAYDYSYSLLSDTEIDTIYTCLEPIKVGQRYGDYEVVDFTRLEGTTYHHYSKFALHTEDALDHILRSINRDPRRGYGWWHDVWVWWCGYTYYRDLWVDDTHLDPQFGAAVFCEERAAVMNLMEVIKNCLDVQGVVDLTFNYTGAKKVDVEVYTLSNWFFGGWWTWFDGFYDLKPGDSFFIDGSSLDGGILTDRIMMRVYDASNGKLLDTIYVRSSGEWFLEVEPGNFYGNFELTASTLLLGDDSEWDDWWGGDSMWWDWFFGFWHWEEQGASRCGWEPEECYDADAAKEEQARICSNVTLLKQVINMLVQADDILARVAWSEAENTTVKNASYADEYKYHVEWAKRYWWRGYDRMKKGRAYDAITDFKNSWRHSMLAMKWALKTTDDPMPDDAVLDPCGCYDTANSQGDFSYPWWMHWYIKYSNWGHLKKCENPEFPCGDC